MKFFVSWFMIACAVLGVLLFASRKDPVLPQGVISVEDSVGLVFSDPEKRLIPAKAADVKNTDDIAINVYNSSAKAYMQMPVSEYLYGVLIAEMPSDFGDEALKAQAVAARTLILYKLKNGCSTDHKDAPVCTGSGHCMAYVSPEAYIKSGGSTDFLLRVKNAVEATAGEYAVYDGDPIMAVFHSSSAERTEDCENVWGASYPYLRSVTSPEVYYPESVKKLYTEKDCDLDAFLKTIGEKYPDFSVSASTVKSANSVVSEKNQNGRVSAVKIGELSISGTSFRSLFSLRSTDFEIKITDTGVNFSVCGYGHGVGMSQYGAKIMDMQGKTYKDILSHYYTGIKIAKLSDIP